MRTRASSAAGAALYVVLVLAILYLLVPLLAVVALSLTSQSYLTLPPEGWSTRWYARLLDNPAWASAARNSLSVGAWTALLSMILGTLAALAIGRGGFAISKTLSAAAVAPIMLPHIILAIGMYPVMADLGMTSSSVSVIVSHTVIGSPLVFITVTAAMKSYNPSLELAAMVLGANPWQTFWKVSFPMLRSGILTGGILAFASSFDELVLALFLTGPDTRTLPRLVWEQLNDFSNPSIAAVASLIMVFTLVLLGAAGLLVQGQVSRPSSRESS